MKNRKALALVLGPFLFVLCICILPKQLFSYEARAAVGTLCWMGIWWVMLPVHVGVTGFIPIVVNALFAIMPMDGLLAKYASDTVFLLLGADLLTMTWKVTGLDKRIALKFLYLSGPSLTQQVLMWFLVSTVFAMFLPNLVVCAMLTPIAWSMLCYIGENDLKKGVIAPMILAAVAWGSGIGGMATPFSGAMNLVAISYIEDLIGCEFMYAHWSVRMVPVLLVVVLFNLVCILIVKPKNADLSGSREYFKTLYKELPKMSKDEKTALFLFVFTVVMTFARQAYASVLPQLKPAYLFITMGTLTFFLRKEDKAPFNSWEHASKNIGWGLILMIAGGMGLGAMLVSTGAVDSFASLMNRMNLDGGFTTMLVFSFFAVVLSEVSNHTSAAAICIPIVISVCKGLGTNPIPFIYTVIAAYNAAYMMPTAVRAIPVGLGLDPGYLMKKGALLTSVTIVVIAVTGYAFMRFWPAFSSY